jgi:hypothetical protein
LRLKNRVRVWWIPEPQRFLRLLSFRTEHEEFSKRETRNAKPETKLRERHAVLISAVLLLLALTACRSDMQDQPRLKPLRRSDFYADGRSARPLLAGTVARGQLREDAYFYTGYVGKNLGDYMPFPATREVLERGRERYNIYCAPCHDRLGSGLGMIVRRGFRHPPSYHIARLRSVPVGYIYDVITNGFGAMPDYAAQIAPSDRWAIVSYVRALQRSQNTTVKDVPPDAMAQLNQGGRP